MIMKKKMKVVYHTLRNNCGCDVKILVQVTYLPESPKFNVTTTATVFVLFKTNSRQLIEKLKLTKLIYKHKYCYKQALERPKLHLKTHLQQLIHLSGIKKLWLK